MKSGLRPSSPRPGAGSLRRADQELQRVSIAIDCMSMRNRDESARAGGEDLEADRGLRCAAPAEHEQAPCAESRALLTARIGLAPKNRRGRDGMPTI